MWKSRAGSAVGWFSLRNSHWLGNCSPVTSAQRDSFPNKTRKTFPGQMIGFLAGKIKVFFPFLFVPVPVS